MYKFNIKSNTLVSQMSRLSLARLLLVMLCVCWVAGVKIEKGQLTLQIDTGDRKENFETYEVAYNGKIKDLIQLTQSSKIDIKAKMTFSENGFVPEFFSFRLRHSRYQNLSEPVLTSWDEQNNVFSALLDLGDPKQIKHMSGQYDLEVIISDDKFETQVRHILAKCKVTFRHSLDQPLPSELDYSVPSIIMTQPPAVRVDPPAMFTGFVVVLLVILFCIFVLGLNYQKLNFNSFPAEGKGVILNMVFLGCLGLVLFMLLKFWLEWTFIETMKYCLLGILPISLAANYAFVHIKKS